MAKYLDNTGLSTLIDLIKSSFAGKSYEATVDALKALIGEKDANIATTVIAAVGGNKTAIEGLKTILGTLSKDQVTQLQALLSKNLAETSDITTAIDALNTAATVGGTGKVVTSITQSKGIVSGTATDLSAANVSATAVTTGGSGTTVQAVLGELNAAITKVTTDAISVAAGDGIDITGTTTKTIAAKVKSNDSYIEVTEDGIASKGIDTAISTAKTEAINTIKGTGVSADYDTLKKIEDKITGEVSRAEGAEGSLSSRIATLEGKKHITVTGDTTISVTGEGEDKTIGVIVSALVGTEDKYLTVTGNKIASKGVDDAISGEVSKLKGTATTGYDTLGGLEAKIKELDGKVGTDVAGQITTKLGELDFTNPAEAGDVILTVSQTDGKISATAGKVAASNVTATAVGGGSATNVQGILGELDTRITAAQSKADAAATQESLSDYLKKADVTIGTETNNVTNVKFGTGTSDKSINVVTSLTGYQKSATTLAGYNIGDAKISGQTITLGETSLEVAKKVDLETLTGTVNGLGDTYATKAAAIGSATYDSETKKIVFKGVDGTTTIGNGIDCTDFIKDGMVDKVVMEGKYLVITFNTVGSDNKPAHEEIRVKIGDLFDVNNYYNKTTADITFVKVSDVLTSDEITALWNGTTNV